MSLSPGLQLAVSSTLPGTLAPSRVMALTAARCCPPRRTQPALGRKKVRQLNMNNCPVLKICTQGRFKIFFLGMCRFQLAQSPVTSPDPFDLSSPPTAGAVSV